MESEDYQLELMCSRARMSERRIRRLITLGTAVAGIALGYGEWKALDAIHANRVSKLKEQSATSKQDRQMMKAICYGDVNAFDQALKEGADFNALNHEGRNALMVSVAEGGDCEIAYHILSTPELAKKVDYKQVDDKGATILDIVDSKIAGSKHPSARLLTIKRLLSENLEKQNQEEAAGKARSGTFYEFASVQQSMQQGK